MEFKNIKTFEQYNKINQFMQPNEWSCGPSSLKMVLDYINNENNNIEDLIRIGNVDSILGSTGRRMKRILDEKRVDYQFVKSFDPKSIIKDINNCYLIVMLVFLDDYPHWIVVSDYKEGKFTINDPYVGSREMSESELQDYTSIKKSNIYSIGSKFLVPNRVIKIKGRKND